MNRLAIFVEGYTEIVFLEKLIDELAGSKNVQIVHRQIRGGTTVRRSMKTIRAKNTQTGSDYYFLLYDCGNDKLVKSRLLEEHERLTKTGYSRLIALRDVKPDFSYADIPRLEMGLPLYVRTKLAPVTFILAIMEIEAWFLAEATHFPRIDPTITVPRIVAHLGFDPENDDMSLRPSPADDLNNCYAIGGKVYRKSQASATVNALDFSLMYMALTQKIKYLNRLISEIDAFLATP